MCKIYIGLKLCLSLSIALCTASYAAETVVKPVEVTPKRIYIAPDDHTDYMWTANEAVYRKAFVEMLDYYLDLADKTQNDAPEYRSRWHADGSYWLYAYEKSKTPAEFDRLMSRFKDGTMSFPLNALVSTYGGQPAEAVLRNMYYAGGLERRFKIKVPLAISMENQTQPYGLGALWAGAGAKYSWKGICGCVTHIDEKLERPFEIYWWKGDDGSRLLMKWNTLVANDRMGGYAEARKGEREVNYVDQDPTFKRRYPYNIIGIFGKGHDDLKTLTDEFPKIAKSNTTKDRQVIVSNMNDFFVDFEKTYGKDLPEYNASFGNEWDVYIASVQEMSSEVKRSVEKLRPAEAMAAIISLKNPEFMTPRKTAKDQAFMDLGLFWEHDWTADNLAITRLGRANWGRRLANEISNYVDTLHKDAALEMGEMIKGQSNKKRFYVFNPLGFVRSDAADIPFEVDASQPVHIVDLTTGETVASQPFIKAATPKASAKAYLRIWAKDLPSVGYKVYEIRQGAGPNLPQAATVTPNGVLTGLWGVKVRGTFMENDIYKIMLTERGAVASLVDKRQNNREFSGQDYASRLNELGLDNGGPIEVENAGPVSVTLKTSGIGPLAHTSRVTLYKTSSRVDIQNEITENFDGTYTWSFDYNLKNPTLRHEEIGTIATAKLKADGGHYAPELSNLEWLTVNHFADMSEEGGAGVTLSNTDLSFMKLGNSGNFRKKTFLDVGATKIKILAGGQIDGPLVGVPKQGGDSYFLQRFSLQSHMQYDAATSMRFALEHQNPPVTGFVTGQRASLPEKTFSLIENSNPEVLLWALKPAEDGPKSGLVARVWNVGQKAQTYQLKLTTGLKGAFKATHIETDIAPIRPKAGGVTQTATPTQIQTVRLIPANRF
jgi:alpha-mannosidase